MQQAKHTTPLQAIRRKCVECSGGQRSEVERCQMTDCDLFVYRFGTNPRRKRIGKVANTMDSASRVAGTTHQTTPIGIGDKTPTQQASSSQQQAL